MPKFYELVVLAIAIISFIVYGGVWYVIYKLRKTEFKTPFFTFVLNLGVTDMSRTMVWLCCITFPCWGWFYSVYRGNNFLANAATFVQLFLAVSQRTNNMLLAANRFTAIVMPYSHLVVWTGGNRRRNVVIGTWLVTIVLAQAHTIGMWWGFEYTVVNGTNLLTPDSPSMPMWFKKFSFLYMMGSCCLATLWYIVTYGSMIISGIKTSFKRANQVTPEDSETRAVSVNLAVEIRLALACFMLALIQAMAAGYYLMIAMNPKDHLADMALFYERWYMIFLCDSLANPWALLIMSSAVRNQFLKQWFCCNL